MKADFASPASHIHDGKPDRLPQRAIRALAETDAMPKALRECVHEFGYAIVKACLNSHVSDPRHIRRLVHEIWLGARQPHQRHSLHMGNDTLPSPVLENLDWILIQAGAGITAASLIRVLWSHSMVILPRQPSTAMIDASVEYTKGKPLMSKTEKHRGQLHAAIEAGAKRLWPHLFK